MISSLDILDGGKFIANIVVILSPSLFLHLTCTLSSRSSSSFNLCFGTRELPPASSSFVLHSPSPLVFRLCSYSIVHNCRLLFRFPVSRLVLSIINTAKSWHNIPLSHLPYVYRRRRLAHHK